MSTFWDSMKSSVVPYPVKSVTESLLGKSVESAWDSIPEQSLEELDNDCVHYFTIPTGQREVIGQCKLCKGESWFKNYYEEPNFNNSTTAEQLQAYADAEQGSDTVMPSIILEGAIA